MHSSFRVPVATPGVLTPRGRQIATVLCSVIGVFALVAPVIIDPFFDLPVDVSLRFVVVGVGFTLYTIFLRSRGWHEPHHVRTPRPFLADSPRPHSYN